MLKKLLAVGALAATLALTGCNEKKEALKIGVMTGPEHQIAEVAAKIAKDKYGLDVKLIEFTDYTQPNKALSLGDLDANAFQTVPYIEQEVKAHGYKIAIIGNTFVYPIAAYSKKVQKLDELREGAIVAIPNNPSNAARSLILLHNNGLIKLKDPSNLFSTELDIVENPKKIEVKQVETALLTRALDDVDLAVINNTYAGQAGLTPEKDGVVVEAKDSPYVNLLTSREDNKGDERLQTFLKSYQTEEVYQEALKLFNGAVVKGW
ncbi:DL-methionine transporter substrate-binding subunit [Pasteurellaceae bacterium RH1A]|nr:DL-methionine transporter substrate-binding subunit [Pasteurellaceae bacterium RH1A]